jgi:ATP-dependent helicase HepA
MVRGSMDLILSSEKGNSSFVIWPLKGREGPPVLIEAIYILECVAPSRLHVDRFLPPTPIRVVVDMNGINLSDTYSHELINNNTRDEEAFRLQKNPEMLHSLIPEMLKSARRFARDNKSELLENAMHEAHAHLDGEARRLRELKEINANVREEEINIAENVIQEITRHIAKAHLRLDSVRLIISDTDV